ncbi:MAG: tetratricopeptide repeat protein, partial [Candidatus Kapaibacteriota bacterium]
PNFFNAYIARGNVYLKIKHLKKALEDFTIAIELAPENPFGYLNRAIAYRTDNIFSYSVSDLNEFLRLYGKEDKLAEKVRTWIRNMGYNPEY